MRFQVQEMARAERMTTDEQIQHELDVYNRLLPGPGELSATLFLELTTEEELRTWLPRLVGIERSVVLEIGDGPGAPRRPLGAGPGARAPADPRDRHLGGALRALPVHPEPRWRRSRPGPVTLLVDHAEYPDGRPGVVLSDATRAELARDLRRRP